MQVEESPSPTPTDQIRYGGWKVRSMPKTLGHVGDCFGSAARTLRLIDFESKEVKTGIDLNIDTQK